MSRPKGLPKTGGRRAGVQNKVVSDIKAMAQLYGEEAVDTLAIIMRDVRQPAAARVSAAKELIDRGYGKALQTTELTGKGGAPLAFQQIERTIVDPKK